jgi:hypothetical protein
MPGPLQRVLRRRGADDPENGATSPDQAPTAVVDAVTTVEEPPPLVTTPPSDGAGEATATPSAGAANGEAPAPGSTDAPAAGEPPVAAELPGWRQRGRMRRRLRYVRRARELALRDLGGLVFDLHRFGRERPDLVTAKLDGLTALEAERRTLEGALADQREVDVLHEPGIASCPRCNALHASDARFCSSCGMPLGGGVPLPAASPEPEAVPGAAAATTDAPGT